MSIFFNTYLAETCHSQLQFSHLWKDATRAVYSYLVFEKQKRNPQQPVLNKAECKLYRAVAKHSALGTEASLVGRASGPPLRCPLHGSAADVYPGLHSPLQRPIHCFSCCFYLQRSTLKLSPTALLGKGCLPSGSLRLSHRQPTEVQEKGPCCFQTMLFFQNCTSSAPSEQHAVE